MPSFCRVCLPNPEDQPIPARGSLALAGACAGAGAAPAISRYLKSGTAVAPPNAAPLQMLAWIEHKTATQLLLAVGSRFRTRGIQEEAGRLAQVLAERQGWTVSELADRTIPAAGMDDDGILTLDFGPRQFTARLNEELELVLSDPDGKTFKALPDPRRTTTKPKRPRRRNSSLPQKGAENRCVHAARSAL